MTVTDDAALGLRERKRRATRRAIQVAVLTQASERGLDGVTIDEVSRLADISPRTFFNYFASKEEALMGDPPELPSADAVERFVTNGARGRFLDDLADLLADAAQGAMADHELVNLRKAILHQNPSLFAMRMATMRKFEDALAAIIERRLLLDDPELAERPEVLTNRARLVTLVVFGVMRHAWAGWASGEHPADLTDVLAHSFAELRGLFARDAA